MIRARVLELLERVGLDDPALRAAQHPHELSGGMRQRVLIAIAIALRPRLIIGDEPTSALDVTVQRRILDLIDDLRREEGTSVLLVTHDLGVAADRAQRIVVLKDGRVVEQGPTADILARAEDPYTRQLLADAPALALVPPRAIPAPLYLRDASAAAAENPYAIVASGLVKQFAVRGRETFRAVDDVSFQVRRGTTHALVGESGSGKTTTARLVTRFLSPDAGTIEVGERDVAPLRGADLRALRRQVQLVYQNPFSSLDPRQSVERIVTEPLHNFDVGTRAERRTRAAELIDRVALPADVLAALAAGALGRAASARRHRPCARGRPRDRRARRSGVGPRCHGAGAHPRAARVAPARTRSHLPLHLARPRGGPTHQPHRVGDAAGSRRRSRRGRGPLHEPATSVHARAARSRAPTNGSTRMTAPTLAFFSRLLDDAPPAERYRLALDQIRHAERFGIGRAWVAQHHFRAAEGGLPSPFVFLAHAAAATSEIRLATGVVTLPLEDPVRVAEDAVVADLLSGGRVDVGLGSGGTPSSFVPFGERAEDKARVYDEKLQTLLAAFGGDDIGAGNTLYPDAGSLADRIWQATFSTYGGTRAGTHGHGLLLSRTQPRPAETPHAGLADIQQPIVDAYLEALPAGAQPRVTASRTVFVADDRRDALRFAEVGLRRAAEGFRKAGQTISGDTLDELIASLDTHLGTPDEVAASLAADETLSRATEVAFQVHSVDAPHDFVLRSIELVATEVAPALGWATSETVPNAFRKEIA